MSSRNMLLSEEARAKAGAIYGALEFIKQNIFNTPVEVLTQDAVRKVLSAGFDKVDYVEICDAETLLPVSEPEKDKKLIVLAAAFIDGVRLIDNLVIF
jgi:pantoate--beta-alanine ligase